MSCLHCENEGHDQSVAERDGASHKRGTMILLWERVWVVDENDIEFENECNESFDASEDARGSYVTYWAILSDFCVAMLVS